MCVCVCDHILQSYHVKHGFDSFTENSLFFFEWNWYPTTGGCCSSSTSHLHHRRRLGSLLLHSVSGKDDLSGLFIGIGWLEEMCIAMDKFCYTSFLLKKCVQKVPITSVTITTKKKIGWVCIYHVIRS